MSGVEAEVIRTERLVLVPQRVEHAREMADVLSDPALHTFIGGAPATADELRSRYARMAAGPADPAESWCNWVIRLREGEENPGQGPLTGTVQATISPAVPGESGPGSWLVAEIAWVVGSAFQGRGIASEAARGLVGWLVRHPVRDIAAHVHPGHAASGAVARAAGLEPTDEWHDGEVRWVRRGAR
ncbi:GNAT family N-acetyltransferase [Streptomyces sp. IB2014 016-6]|uniref:GNAT family N-acetyltransferase n=1 Tax=Streptomyces sp. IB2014 016-6 TaxID=2517818 RepID=UPI0011C9CC48|nr:GNAT family N-acetyltransferase [Streptomyces sp. IB2014 016-6]TXL92781.1 N-acetyltransferase [Streptomyces sp. IB2014 016-6]